MHNILGEQSYNSLNKFDLGPSFLKNLRNLPSNVVVKPVLNSVKSSKMVLSVLESTSLIFSKYFSDFDSKSAYYLDSDCQVYSLASFYQLHEAETLMQQILKLGY